MRDELHHNGDGDLAPRTRYATVGGAERLISSAAGGALVSYGLMRRSLGGAALAAAGTALLLHGLRRHSTIYHALGLSDVTAHERGFWSHPFARDVRAGAMMTIHRSAEELYREWRDLSRQPRYFTHLAEVVVLDERRSHWRARGPLGTSIEWDAEITRDEPGRHIAWRAAETAHFQHTGEVRFEPAGGNRGSRVSVAFVWSPPAGAVGVSLARLLPQDPQREVREGLRRFKQWMETGEIATGNMQNENNSSRSKTDFDADLRSEVLRSGFSH